MSATHKQEQQILIISDNDINWTVMERNAIMKRAADIYLEEKHVRLLQRSFQALTLS